jgi:hypothetical protein
MRKNNHRNRQVKRRKIRLFAHLKPNSPFFSLDRPNSNPALGSNSHSDQNTSSLYEEFLKAINSLSNNLFEDLNVSLLQINTLKTAFKPQFWSQPGQTISPKQFVSLLGFLKTLTSAVRGYKSALASASSVKDYESAMTSLMEENKQLRLNLLASTSKNRGHESALASKEEEIKQLRANLLVADSKVGELESALTNWEEKYKKLQAKFFVAEMELAKPALNSSNSGRGSHLDIIKNHGFPNLNGKPVETSGGAARGQADQPKRPQGGQDGHPQKNRKPLTEEEADHTDISGAELEGTTCPKCGKGKLTPAPDHNKQEDHFKLPPALIIKTREIIEAYRCSHCGKLHFAEKINKNGLVSAELLALMTEFNVKHHLPISKIQQVFESLLDLSLSTGYINNCLKRVGFALRPLYLEILDSLKNEPILNVDETSFKNKEKRVYTWTFRGLNVVSFIIGTRSRFILDVVLGPDYKGLIGCDCYGAYFSFLKDHPDVILQLCLAHLIRDFKYCYDFNHPKVQRYGERALDLLGQIFHIYHEYIKFENKDCPEAKERHYRLHELAEELKKAALDAPSECRKAMALAKRFAEYGDYYFQFIDNSAVAPTNNAAELAIRDIVLTRKISYGAQSTYGVRYYETMWTIFSNIKLKKIDPRPFLTQVIKAYESGEETIPSLLNYGENVDPKYIELARQEHATFLEEDRKKKAESTKKRTLKRRALREKSSSNSAEKQSSESNTNTPPSNKSGPNSESSEKPEPSPAPSPGKERGSKPSPAPSPDKERESKSSPASSPDKERGAKPSPAPSPDKERESKPSPASSPDKERESKPSPAPSPGKERESKPSPAPSSVKERESKPSPAPSPGKERESKPSPAPSPGKEREPRPKRSVNPKKASNKGSEASTPNPAGSPPKRDRQAPEPPSMALEPALVGPTSKTPTCILPVNALADVAIAKNREAAKLGQAET